MLQFSLPLNGMTGMLKIKLGIIREGKIPADRRVPFTPDQAKEIMHLYPDVKVVCQTSRVRCFKDSEYAQRGIEIVTSLYDCDIIMGIKEVPVSNLIGGKTYLFFSHTMKRQPHNRRLLQMILKKKITLIDYEALKDNNGNRLVAFGRYAGIVGTYNGLWTYGKRYQLYSVRRAYRCYDFNDLKTEFPKIKLPPIKIVLTGSGRVGAGATEVLNAVGIRKVSIEDFLNTQFSVPVYVQLSSRDYHLHREGKPFDRDEFHKYPQRYESDFLRYASVADILIAGAYWNPGAPPLFTKDDMKAPSFKIKVIADISCDINGSIPATIRATDVNDPIYDYNPFDQRAEPPLSNEKFITVMAIDNLPCELPRSASEDFGRDLIDRILPSLLKEDSEYVIARGTMTKNGMLTENFSYLKDYAS